MPLYETPVRGVVPRVVALLNCLSGPDVDSLTLSELSAATGIPLQSTARILNDLADAGLALHDTRSKQWTVGPLAFTLAHAAERQIQWIDPARAALTRLTNATKETTILTAREGAYGTHVDIVVSPQPLQLTESIGLRRPLTMGGSRRVMLAFLSESEQRSVLSRLEEDGVYVDRLALQEQLAEIRDRGYGVSRGEVTPHTIGIAVPIMQATRVVASIMIAGPDQRMPDSTIEWLAQCAQNEATSIALGWTESGHSAGIADREQRRK